jgi:hypothetical protein
MQFKFPRKTPVISQVKAMPRSDSNTRRFDISSFPAKIKGIWLSFSRLGSFVLLLILFQICKKIIPMKLLPVGMRAPLELRLNNILNACAKVLERNNSRTISRLDIIELSFRNMQAKKARTMITVGGMSIGVGAIVFLVSIGYGLQQLVISRVARLDEMRQVDVYSQTGSAVKINDQTLNAFKEVSKVESVLPLITAVGRVNYQNSVSDMAVFGVTADYLNQSAIKPVKGAIFKSNEVSAILPSKGQVAGVSTSRAAQQAAYGEDIARVEYVITEGEWVRVRQKPDSRSKIVGYTRRVEGSASGQEVWGKKYVGGEGDAGTDENGEPLGKWIIAKVPLWSNQACEGAAPECEEKEYVPMKMMAAPSMQKDI